MLQEAAALVYQEFDFNHVGFYIIDEQSNEAVLKNSIGKDRAGSPQKNLTVSLSEGVISQAISFGEAFTHHEGDDQIFKGIDYQHPTSRSFAVLPLRAREQIVGAITLQSTHPSPFDRAFVYTLQILVDQIAMLLVNARLFVERETALEAERRAYGELTQSAWKQIIQSRTTVGYRRDKSGITPAGEIRSSQDTSDGKTISIPIHVRGQLIGFVDAQKPPQSGFWKTSESELLESIAERLESALDTARLYEDTQLLAEQERLVGEVTTKMRETLDIETVLKTAVREIRSAMDIPKVTVRLRSNLTPEDESPIQDDHAGGMQ